MKAKNILFTVIRVVLVAGLIAAIVGFIFKKNNTANVPAETVFAKVEASIATDKMQPAALRYFKKYYGLNASDYEAVLYYAPISNMDAEELLVVKMKSTEQEEAVTEAILKRQSDKQNSFEGYAPEEYALAQNYILSVKGSFVLFVIDEAAVEIEAAFAGAF